MDVHKRTWNPHAATPPSSCASAPLTPPHYIVVIVLALALYTEDTDGVGDSLNVLIFTDL